MASSLPTARRSGGALRTTTSAGPYSALVASLVIGCVWTFWHVPKLLTEGGPGYPIWLFVLDTMAKAVLFTWIFNRTGGSPAHRHTAARLGEHLGGVPPRSPDRW
jgi:hypothetical protein